VQSIITQGEKATLQSADQTLTKSAFIFEEGSPDWMAGRFIFEDQPLRVVLDELERQYNIKVQLEPSLEQMNYTGLFESGDLEQALKLITWPLHLESKTEGTTITIYR
jgi:ferric-dicitrate binding protein FerR (iron transport regulator)